MQLLPPIGRLCEPIQSTSLADIARALGLDAAKYEARYSALTSDQDRLSFESYYSGATGANDDEAFQVRRVQSLRFVASLASFCHVL